MPIAVTSNEVPQQQEAGCLQRLDKSTERGLERLGNGILDTIAWVTRAKTSYNEGDTLLEGRKVKVLLANLSKEECDSALEALAQKGQLQDYSEVCREDALRVIKAGLTVTALAIVFMIFAVVFHLNSDASLGGTLGAGFLGFGISGYGVYRILKSGNLAREKLEENEAITRESNLRLLQNLSEHTLF